MLECPQTLKGELKSKTGIFCIIFIIESLSQVNWNSHSYSCPFLGFCEKISFKPAFFPLVGHFHCGPVMWVSGMM